MIERTRATPKGQTSGLKWHNVWPPSHIQNNAQGLYAKVCGHAIGYFEVVRFLETVLEG